jgi:hypothetical protein
LWASRSIALWGEDRIVEERDPLVDRPVRGDDGRGAAVPFEDDLVEVARLLGVEPAESEVIDDQDVGREQAAEDLVGGVIGARLVERLQEMVGAQEEDVAPGSALRVTERTGEEGLPDPDSTLVLK